MRRIEVDAVYELVCEILAARPRGAELTRPPSEPDVAIPRPAARIPVREGERSGTAPTGPSG
jgi:hypothetical protein